jgi:threonine aldolase
MYSATKSNPPTSIIADFRSDTVTTPTPEMHEYMKNTIVGDDVFGDDPTVQELEKTMAQLTGKEASLYCVSGTLSNELAIRTHLKQPPFSVICDKSAHVHVYEAGGISYHNGAQVIPVAPSGTHLTLSDIKKEIVLDDDVHHAPTKLICLENTKNGQVFPLNEQVLISKFARENGIGIHLDGARLWNASIKTGKSIKELCSPFDSVSLCFSKGLGAPIGSVLVGDEGFIRKARHFRKLFGGGWRQAGILAAACLFTLNHHFPKLHKDHENALQLSKKLQSIGFKLTKPTETNMVWVDLASFGLTCDKVAEKLSLHGIKILGGNNTELRLVTHHQISRDSIIKLSSVLESMIKSKI